MRLIPSGDYYFWICDWCDSTNQTLWTRVETNQLRCAACGKSIPLMFGIGTPTYADVSVPLRQHRWQSLI